MKDHLAQLARRNALLACAFLLATAAPILAQTPAPVDRFRTEQASQQAMNQREMALRGYGLTPVSPSNRKKLEALAHQVEQDFNRILVLHNEIARAISGEKSLDYGFVSNATTEIGKRATRLQSTLMLKPEENKQRPDNQIGVNDTQVKDTLITLCKQIKSFVTNPVIEKPGTVSVEQLNKARHDLQSVVELSFGIKKTAEKLAKASK